MIRFIFILVGLALAGLIVSQLMSEKGRRSLVLALRSLRLHKLRSLLSVLGIIIGTSAVIILMAFGEGSMHDTLEAIKRLGATNIIIRSVKPPDDSSTTRRTRIAQYGLTNGDYHRLLTIGTVTRHVPMRIFSQEVRHGALMLNGRAVGTTPVYAEVNKLELSVGRFLTEHDGHYRINVAVLAANTADKLFPFEDPIGQSVRLDKYFYTVVGVVKPRMPTGGTGGSQAAEVFDNDVYIPLETFNVRFGEKTILRTTGSMNAEQVELSQITLTIGSNTDVMDEVLRDKVRSAGSVVHQLLETYHPKTDYAVTIPLDRLQEAEDAKDSYTKLLAVIASISLLVGGIGIMNIMLATVTERTREIGIRRALGAKRRDITLQFLIEAVVQTTLGGMVGLIAGLLFVVLVPVFWKLVTGSHLAAQLNTDSIFYSLGVSIGVGVLFGWYPARRASYLDPIEALRHN
ncbi:MAG TPA: ABC transporter permease [Gemmataceae bacterium]|nr:ABC transporter permease [Gemmataceae bacterium]